MARICGKPSHRYYGGPVAAALCAIILLPPSLRADTWCIFLSPGVSAPVSLMADYYNPSPTVAGGMELGRTTVSYRFTIAYTALWSAVDVLPDTLRYIDDPATRPYDLTWVPRSWRGSLGGVVHHLDVTADVVIPKAFSLRRLYLLGGVGAGYRRLNEGRQFDVLLLDENQVAIRTRVRRGFGGSTVDLIARLGVGVHLWTTPRWSLRGETTYQTSFAARNPSGISLDLRVDEAIRLGLVLTMNLGASPHRD